MQKKRRCFRVPFIFFRLCLSEIRYELIGIAYEMARQGGSFEEEESYLKPVFEVIKKLDALDRDLERLVKEMV